MTSRPHQVVALTMALLGAAASLACRTQSNGQPAQTAATADTPDGGPPRTSPSSRHGVIVPSDMGLGAGASGTTTSTGTNGGAVGPTLGSPTGGN